MKEEIEYSEHLKFRLKIREIPENLPEKIYRQADERYIDTLTSYNIALKYEKYKGKERPIVVVYEKIVEKVIIITIHPSDEYEIENRIKRGRWKKL